MGVVRFVLFPFEKILLGCANGAVLQPLRVVSCKYQLHGAEEPRIEFRLLIGKVLSNAVADRDAAVLKLDDADAIPFTYNTRSGRRSRFPFSVTSSAMAKSFSSGSCQLIRCTVSVTLPASVFT